MANASDTAAKIAYEATEKMKAKIKRPEE